MVIVYHKNNKIVDVVSSSIVNVSFDKMNNIANGMIKLAEQFPQSKMVWCHTDCKNNLDLEALNTIFHHNKMMLSYTPDKKKYLGDKIGYTEESPFIKINKTVSYPTWQMSSWVGVIHATVLLEIKDKIKLNSNFDYYLTSVAKVCLPLGLLCYSEPQLLKQKTALVSMPASTFTLFRFVKQHYKTQWVFLLLFNLFLYERKFPVLPFLFSLFYKNRTKANIDLDAIKVESSRKVIDKAMVDVIIPTIGRKNYLYDVLKDFSKQTVLPSTIIIVEQNPKVGSESELEYVTTEEWPFQIQHIFTHQAGACHARNLALDQTQSEWVFLADDDNRFEASLLSNVFEKITQYGNTVVTTSYPQKNESKKYLQVIQWPTFGAGNSFVRRDILEKVRFNMAFEFGYGEDGDFGMQLRKKGCDVLYLPEPEILHLKAPMGGFRTKPVQQWQDDNIQPKPSPTILLYQLLHHSKEQRNSYKTTLFFKYYRLQTIKNPLKYYVHFQKQWGCSLFWANELRKQNEV